MPAGHHRSALSLGSLRGRPEDLDPAGVQSGRKQEPTQTHILRSPPAFPHLSEHTCCDSPSPLLLPRTPPASAITVVFPGFDVKYNQTDVLHRIDVCLAKSCVSLSSYHYLGRTGHLFVKGRITKQRVYI